MQRIAAKQLTDVITGHGEGPVYDQGARALRCVDLQAGDIVTLPDAGGLERLHVGEVAAAWRPRADGGLVVAVERGFRLVGADGSLGPVTEAFDDPSIRMNDGSCDPVGRFYCGSMAYDERPGAAALWRFDPDGSTHRVLDGVTISNGLAFAPDGTWAYYIDTPTRRVDVLRFDADGQLIGREPFLEIPEQYGAPDGMTVDADGGLWIALWGGHAVHGYAPDGTLHTVVALPASQVTACTFGGPDLDRLYITTSRKGLPPDAEPSAGAVFVCQPGVSGRPTPTFAG